MRVLSEQIDGAVKCLPLIVYERLRLVFQAYSYGNYDRLGCLFESICVGDC